MTPELRRWLSDARSITVRSDAERYTKRIFTATLKFVAQNQWQGACHGTSAILALLLNAGRVQAVPCLGECYADNYYFDHSWIEIDGLVYDAAIAVPLIPSHRKPPVFAGRSVDPTSPAQVCYGVTSGKGYGADAAVVAEMPFAEYLTVDELREVASARRWRCA